MTLILLTDQPLPDQTPTTVADLTDTELTKLGDTYREHRYHYAAVTAYLLVEGDRMLPEAREFAAESVRLAASWDVLHTERHARHSIPQIIAEVREVMNR
ncbi:hypothetical protein [Microbacterium allomyrinae]|uniref:Uncharacterized protein n=1 Tax=Microbacterium allomyrinae TaxID=2830666 RepID=A0A9X1S2W0_9MICO|nr:hypothetical protein [Microbacterium allomyrinae]MCC2033101.1 hypothetical protein [Microbacterium allomyrinae]